jgi:hypothetical protein
VAKIMALRHIKKSDKILENEMFPYSSLPPPGQETACARGLIMNCVMGTVTVSVGFNRANALSLREFVPLLEVESEQVKKLTMLLLKWLRRGSVF